MAQQPNQRKPDGLLAQIATLGLVEVTLGRLTQRRSGLPGIGVLYGPPGWGKSFCANEIAKTDRQGVYVQIRSSWSRKALLQAIAEELGTETRGTLATLLDGICAELTPKARTRVLILDEFDHCTRSDLMVELVRDIYEGSQGSMLLIGEEKLPRKLEHWERLHSRVLSWAPALPVSVEDAAKLATIYCPNVELREGVLARLVESAQGSVRRVCVNLSLILDHCMTFGSPSVGVETLDREIKVYTGRSPEPRKLPGEEREQAANRPPFTTTRNGTGDRRGA
jgi:DNA transposition AAA+ family ATPase